MTRKQDRIIDVITLTTSPPTSHPLDITFIYSTHIQSLRTLTSLQHDDAFRHDLPHAPAINVQPVEQVNRQRSGFAQSARQGPGRDAATATVSDGCTKWCDATAAPGGTQEARRDVEAGGFPNGPAHEVSTGMGITAQSHDRVRSTFCVSFCAVPCAGACSTVHLSPAPHMPNARIPLQPIRQLGTTNCKIFSL